MEFSNLFPGLCEGKCMLVPSCISQPCLPLNSSGPTRILPHLYLGCQRDVLNRVSYGDDPACGPGTSCLVHESVFYTKRYYLVSNLVNTVHIRQVT